MKPATRKKTAATTTGGDVKSILALVLLLFLLVGFSCLWVGVRVLIVQTGYEIHAAMKRQNELLHRQRELMIETAALESPDRLARIAHGSLGLDFPRAGQVIVIPPVRED